MKIEINPRTLIHLENICEVLYKLHPYVLDYLVDMQRSLGNLLGFIDLNNPTLEQRDFLIDNFSDPDSYSKVELPFSSKLEPESRDPPRRRKQGGFGGVQPPRRRKQGGFGGVQPPRK